MEKTLIIVKPVMVEKNLIGSILNFFETKSFEIRSIRNDGIIR